MTILGQVILSFMRCTLPFQHISSHQKLAVLSWSHFQSQKQPKNVKKSHFGDFLDDDVRHGKFNFFEGNLTELSFLCNILLFFEQISGDIVCVEPKNSKIVQFMWHFWLLYGHLILIIAFYSDFLFGITSNIVLMIQIT